MFSRSSSRATSTMEEKHSDNFQSNFRALTLYIWSKNLWNPGYQKLLQSWMSKNVKTRNTQQYTYYGHSQYVVIFWSCGPKNGNSCAVRNFWKESSSDVGHVMPLALSHSSSPKYKITFVFLGNNHHFVSLLHDGV